MHLTELAEEYRVAAGKLQGRLSELRARLETASNEESTAIQCRIEALAGELTDLRIVISYLKNYYSN